MARKGLGRGLNALLESTGSSVESKDTVNTGVLEIDIRKIEPNRSQPRRYFDEAALNELAESIRAYGIIQPVIVKDCGGYYSIIAGERRYRAARIAGLDTVPAVVKDLSELETLQIALIENLQRQDLTPIEEAMCYRRLIDDFFFSQEDIAGKIGKNRTSVSNTVRLLELDERVQELVSAGKLSVSHARALLAISDGDTQLAVADYTYENELSVRGLEVYIAALIEEKQEKEPEEAPKVREAAIPEAVSAAYRRAEEELKTLLGAKVNIHHGKKDKSGNQKGRIEIEYYSADELDRLLGLLKTNIPNAPSARAQTIM